MIAKTNIDMMGLNDKINIFEGDALKVLSKLNNKYDFIFIDTNSNIFLDSTKWALQECSRVLFVTEDSNISLKKNLIILQKNTPNKILIIQLLILTLKRMF